ncbi:hypothetical protein BAnh1_10950 [Bartonella australis AUST/NH1]|uniref:Uncharacterized protein n=1 Tax=Bartonella australis (strain Aust/NH1) TaxID=1094489 RepID=M1NUM4_BARAA|nr:hypothetical protein [Bartonella australis]AGF74963.1 hypothetical protein BAnh1_10950 [Bartonella australis AUST/NH1]
MTKENRLSSRGRGRPKGSLNKTTKLLKDALIAAAEQAGSHYGHDGLVSYLQYHAINNPVPFFSLLAKVLPLQVTGEGGGNVQTISRVEIIPVVPSDAATNNHGTSPFEH